MTSTAKTTDRPRALPWAIWDRELEAEIRRHNVTAEQVEAIYQASLRGEFARTPRPAAQVVRSAAPAQNYTPSDAQIGFLDRLLAEREHGYTVTEIAAAKADWRKIRPMIDDLKVSARRQWQNHDLARAPKVEAPAATSTSERLDFSAIPDGNYAVREDGVVKFYRVSTNGQWKNVQVRASDQLWPVRGRGGIAVLHRIVEAGLAESRMLFVTELGRCCKCGRSLTDEQSRANALENGGYGPDCVNGE